MKVITMKRFVVVEAETGQEYAKAIDGYLTNMNLRNVSVEHRDRDNFCGYVTYEETKRIPETIKDEYELLGITFTCGDCPYRKGTDDKRIKHFRCEAEQEAYVLKHDSACDLFYRMLRSGDILKGGEIG